MKSSHTPGPWKVEKPYNEGGHYVTAHINTGLICSLYPPDDNLFNQDKKCTIEQNARLIAAAPELLEALQACITNTPDCDITKHRERLAEINGIARDAIAKAEGNQ